MLEVEIIVFIVVKVIFLVNYKIKVVLVVLGYGGS